MYHKDGSIHADRPINMKVKISFAGFVPRISRYTNSTRHGNNMPIGPLVRKAPLIANTPHSGKPFIPFRPICAADIGR